MDEPDDNLPALIIPEVPEVTQETAQTELIKSDLKIAHMQLSGLMGAWQNVTSIVGVTRLVDATIKAIKCRRDILGVQYGHISKGSQGNDFTPLD